MGVIGEVLLWRGGNSSKVKGGDTEENGCGGKVVLCTNEGVTEEVGQLDICVIGTKEGVCDEAGVVDREEMGARQGVIEEVASARVSMSCSSPLARSPKVVGDEES